MTVSRLSICRACRVTKGLSTMVSPNTAGQLHCTSPVSQVRRSSSDASATAKDSLSFTLPDGRQMGYLECGSDDGYPVLYFHGFPSSRLEGSVMDNAARKRRLRILSLERPGFGISTYQANRRITDYPKDVEAFAKHMGLDRFAIMGCSGGGPYALACAHLLPRDLVSGVGLLSTGGPYDKSWEGIPIQSKIGHYAAHYTPWALGAMAGGVVGAAKWLMRTKPITIRLYEWMRAQAEKNGDGVSREERTPEERRENLIRLLFDGFAQGSPAAVQEAQILSQHWGFDLEDVHYSPVRIWHGSEDVNAPIEWIRPMAERLPYSKLTEFKGETHGSIIKHLEWIFTELVSESVSGQSQGCAR